MTEADWLHIVLAITGVPALILFIYLSIRDKSLSRLSFGFAILSYLSGISLSYVSTLRVGVSTEWGNLMAITFTLCALFLIIRNSKPIFARFPIYMTAMPFLGVLFYPMMNDAVVVKDLLMIIYEGGAIVVGMLIFGINQFILKNRSVLLIAILTFCISYVMYWFVEDSLIILHESLSILLFSISVLIASFGFKIISDNETER